MAWPELVKQERRYAEDKRQAFPELVLNILVAIEDGTIKEREHFVRVKDDRIALHLKSVAPALFRAGHGRLPSGQMRSLFHFGWLHVRGVVRACSERIVFGPEEGRRRAVILHLPSAWKFVAGRRKAVPSR